MAKAFMHLMSMFLMISASTFSLYARALPSIEDSRIEKLKTEKISVGGQIITVEIADTGEARERGLMYRTSMPAQNGMLFIFEQAQLMVFWMKNTLIPLSIGYFGADRKLIATYEMTPAVMGEVHPKTYPSERAALYALEMNKGWFEKHHIKPGTEIKFLTNAKPRSKQNQHSKTP